MPLPPDPVMNMRERWRGEAFDFRLEALQKFEDLLRLLGVVALIVLPENLVGSGVDHHGFHRGRADVHADEEVFVHVAS